jgi:penicillin-binding protein 1A
LNLESVVPDEPISVPDGANEPKWIANYDGRFKGPISARQGLAESRNAAAIWIESQIGIDSILSTARRLGVSTPLHRYPTTALGASEMNLLELANAYRTMASGVFAHPYVIRRVVQGGVVGKEDTRPSPVVKMDAALLLIQEGLRGVVRLPGGTAHALASSAFPIAVMGKTGTTNDFRDALFVGSTYGIKGITVAVRIGFDDNRSLGSGETGARLALPVFREVMRAIYREQLAGPVPRFPAPLEARITAYLQGQSISADRGRTTERQGGPARARLRAQRQSSAPFPAASFVMVASVVRHDGHVANPRSSCVVAKTPGSAMFISSPPPHEALRQR